MIDIEELSPTAEELFATIGFENVTTSIDMQENLHRVYRYENYDEWNNRVMHINFVSNKYEVWAKDNDVEIFFSSYPVRLHQAIHQQLIELAWI